MPRHRYEPQQCGWITIEDSWKNVIAAIDCTRGGAQRAFALLCSDFERVGWELQQGKFDSRFMKRGSIRWHVAIRPGNPFVRDTLPGFMALMVADGHAKRE